MSNQKQETVADIVNEMRQAEATWHRSEIAQLPTQYLKEWGDRIEAAAKREVSELRKGISELLDALQTIYDEECTDYGTGEVYDKWRKVLEGASND